MDTERIEEVKSRLLAVEDALLDILDEGPWVHYEDCKECFYCEWEHTDREMATPEYQNAPYTNLHAPDCPYLRGMFVMGLLEKPEAHHGR